MVSKAFIFVAYCVSVLTGLDKWRNSVAKIVFAVLVACVVYCSTQGATFSLYGLLMMVLSCSFGVSYNIITALCLRSEFEFDALAFQLLYAPLSILIIIPAAYVQWHSEIPLALQEQGWPLFGSCMLYVIKTCLSTMLLKKMTPISNICLKEFRYTVLFLFAVFVFHDDVSTTQKFAYAGAIFLMLIYVLVKRHKELFEERGIFLGLIDVLRCRAKVDEADSNFECAEDFHCRVAMRPIEERRNPRKSYFGDANEFRVGLDEERESYAAA